MDTTTCLQRNPEIEHSYLDNEVVMLNIDNGNYYNLNEVGSRIWEILGNKALTVKEIADGIMAEFNIDAETCMRDIIRFCTDAVQQGLLVSKVRKVSKGSKGPKGT